MSYNPTLAFICLAGLAIAPILASNRSTAITSNITSKTLINKEFTVKVNDISKSNNGFITCKFFVEDIKKELIGPCSTTEDKELTVGRTYTVSSATVDRDFIVINNAKLIAGMIRRQVVRVGHIGWTRMAWLDNGSVIGADNTTRVGDWISIE